MIDAKLAKSFVTSTNLSPQECVLEAILNSLYSGKLHAKVSLDLYDTAADLRDLGYTVIVTSESCFIYWS